MISPQKQRTNGVSGDALDGNATESIDWPRETSDGRRRPSNDHGRTGRRSRSERNERGIDVSLERHGIDGLATALEYAREYVDGTVNALVSALENSTVRYSRRRSSSRRSKRSCWPVATNDDTLQCGFGRVHSPWRPGQTDVAATSASGPRASVSLVVPRRVYERIVYRYVSERYLKRVSADDFRE